MTTNMQAKVKRIRSRPGKLFSAVLALVSLSAHQTSGFVSRRALSRRLPRRVHSKTDHRPHCIALYSSFEKTETSKKSEVFTTDDPSEQNEESLASVVESIAPCSSLQKSETSKTSTCFPSDDPLEETPGSLASLVPSSQGLIDDKMLYVMMGLIFAVGSLSSLDRVAMSVALIPMSEEMGYTDTMKGSISSLFSVGYGLAILPSGLLIASLSPRTIMAVGITLWSIGTIATPIAAAQTSMAILLGARVLVGASESVVIPTIQRLLSNWVSPEKKSVAVATVFAGFQTGTILAYSLSPFLIDQFGDWRALFYMYGFAGLLFLIPWLSLAKDAPASNESPSEISKIASDGMTNNNEGSSAIENAKNVLAVAPWKEFAKSKGVWAMFFAHAANNWGLYNNLSWTPTFYAEQYGLNVKESALLLVVPSIAGAIGGLTAGTIADRVIQNLEDSTDEAITRIRKLFQGIALFGPSLCMGTLAYTMPEEPIVAQSLFAVSVGLQSFNAAGYGAANQEKAGEKWTGLLYSITSLPAVMVGTSAVYLTGQILDSTDQNWSIVFALNSLVYFLGAAAFVTLYDSKKEFD
jgi:ACS family sodium-dependent inorganic phosphate cotransporter